VSSVSVIDAHLRRAIAGAATLEGLGAVARTAARRIAGSQGATFVLKDGDRCFYADEDTIAPLWKGQRFPVDECISGWAMLHGEPAVIADITVDERIPQAAYLSTYVRSLVMVPVGSPAAAAIGTYWASTGDHSAAVRPQTELAALVAARLDQIGLADAPWAPNFKVGDVRA
jgi:GAF domain-containing protein